MALYKETKGGMQRSDTTDAEVIIYHRGEDPIILTGDKRHLFGGKRPTDAQGMVVGVDTSSMLGAAAGDFTITCKPANSDLFFRIVDDDWVDIVFKKHGKAWHTMRGIVKQKSRSRQVAGATSETLVISGKEWGQVFQDTPIWFNRFSAENLAGAISYKVFSAENIGGNVAKVVEAFLFGFLRELAGYGRANWELPEDMPVPNSVGTRFINNVWLDRSGWADDPQRIAVTPSFTQPSGKAWELAQSWSDPVFCELFTELQVNDEFAPEVSGQGPEAPLGQTTMAVMLRDRPFPTLAKGLNSPWFKLPTFIVPRFSLVNDEAGMSGLERYNAYFVGPQMVQEMIGTDALDLVRPLWDPADIEKHGLRRFDIGTQYIAKEGKSLGMAESLRERIRDWYCLNPYLLNGAFPLAHGRFDIHKGARVRIPGLRGPDEDETYYCEGIAHAWRYGQGARTNLTLTRGWRGSDESLLEALTTMAARYESPEPATAGA